MKPEVWRKVSDIFSDCLILPESERTTFLTNLEATHPEITKEVRKLLAAYDQDQGFLEKSAIEEEAGSFDTVESPRNRAEQEEEGFAPELRLPRKSGARQRNRTFWWLLAGNAVVFFCFVMVCTQVAHYRNVATDVGWWAQPATKGYFITSVDDDGPALGSLQVGDRVESVDGQRVWLAAIQAVPPNATYKVRVWRQGQVHELVLRKTVVPNPKWFGGSLSIWIVCVTFLLTAVTVSIMRPGPWIITLAWAGLVGEALTLLYMLLAPYDDFISGWPASVYWLMQFAVGPHLGFSFHFYSRVFGGERRRLVSKILVAFFYVWGTCQAVFLALVWDRHPFLPVLTFFWDHPRFFVAANIAVSGFYLVAPASICIAIGYSYFRAQSVEERRRARWIVAGSLAGIVPYFVLRLGNVLGITGVDFRGPLGILPSALIPLATGYAILKHRLFDIHVVLRRGLQYLVARNGLRFVLALPALALLYSLVTNANRTVAEVVLHNSIFIVLVVLLAIVLRFRQRLGSWLDRRFFREGYQQEQILLALIGDLGNVDSIPEMGERVARKLTDALHPESVYFFYHSPKDRAFVRGFGTDERADGLLIPESSALPVLLAGSDRAMSVESFPSNGVPLMSWSWLYTLRIDLVVPMNRADGAPVGFLLLGRKKSEEPYSPTDRGLLLGLARAMAVGCENLSLQERVLRQQRSNEDMRARVEGISTEWLQECPDCGRCYDSTVHTCSIDGTELVLSSPVHRLLGGRYRLDRVLGRGGMGTVFEALDLRLNRQVAIKVVQAGRTVNPAWLRRFAREARALARLNHENIVLTYDFGIVEDEVAYLTMEFVPGATLRTELDRSPIPPAEAADLFRQLLDGVQAAHAAGMVHRDLKPENLLIARTLDGQAQLKIADFGIAKWHEPDSESASLTLPGTIVGSLRYMSPEQLEGQPVDARSDLFSIGVIAFEALTGKLPFSGSSHAERMVSISNDTGRFESEFQGAPLLLATIRKCLSQDPGDRFASATALQAELIPRLRDCHLRQGEPTEECA